MHLQESLPTVSVIIPIWNDAEHLKTILAALANVPSAMEIIVGDASDGAECAQIARQAGAQVVICPAPSRGKQMNAAAEIARGDVLLFLHADTEISEAHLISLRQTMADHTVVGGAYYRRFNPHHRARKNLEPIIRWFNRRKGATLWGDQSMFVRTAHFRAMGGFAPIPIMEDMDFSRRLHQSGKVALIDPPVWSSARRHKAYGSWFASLEILCVVQLYKLGATPEWIHQHYYRRRKAGRQGPPQEESITPQPAGQEV